MRVPERYDVHHHPDPADAWQLVRVKTEVTIQLRDERLRDGSDPLEVFEACVEAMRATFGLGCEAQLATAMEAWLRGYRQALREWREAAERRRQQVELACGRRVPCPDCGAVFTRAGLPTHRRYKHEVKP